MNHLLTHHKMTQLQTCKLSHPTSLDLDIGQVHQLIQPQRDPVIQITQHSDDSDMKTQKRRGKKTNGTPLGSKRRRDILIKSYMQKEEIS